MKNVLFVLAFALAGFAHAGNDVPGNCGNGSGSGNACLPSGGQGGAGGAGGNGTGVGIGVGVGIGLGVGVSHSDSSASAAATGGTGYGGKGGNADASATGGNASAAGGQGSGNATSVTVGGDSVTYKAASAAAYSPDLPTVARSCRLYVGLGGASTSGSGSGGIPIGNDQTCLSGASIDYMVAVNRAAPGTFKGGDFLAVACKVEGMADTAACKK